MLINVGEKHNEFICETLVASESISVHLAFDENEKLFVFALCMQKHLFAVTRAASEHSKSQRKQSSNNSCYLDIPSLLTKVEREICVLLLLLHYDGDRIVPSDFKNSSVSLWSKNNKLREFAFN